MGQEQIKKIKGKVVFKHETAADWEKSEYIPDKGEQVFYDIDENYNYVRVKHGNGVDKVKDLPFAQAEINIQKIDNSADGVLATYAVFQNGKQIGEKIEIIVDEVLTQNVDSIKKFIGEDTLNNTTLGAVINTIRTEIEPQIPVSIELIEKPTNEIATTYIIYQGSTRQEIGRINIASNTELVNNINATQKELEQTNNQVEDIKQKLNILYHDSTSMEEKSLSDFVSEQIQPLKDDKADKATSLSGYGIEDAYTKEETDNLISSSLITNLTHGTGNQALQLNAGVATGDYSFAGGSNDKEIVSQIVGSTLAESMITEAPLAEGNESIAFGINSEAKTTSSLAMGPLNRSGIKGLYYTSIVVDENKKTTAFQLSEKRGISEGILLANKYGWEKGDIVSFVNGKQYPYFGEIDEINGNIITIKNTISSIKEYSATSEKYYLPDDFTIFACYKKEVAKVTVPIIGTVIAENHRWYPRNGKIELGWAAVSFGIENLSSGTASFSNGYNNWSVGDYSFTEGRENIAGYSAHAEGTLTKALGNYSHTEGYSSQTRGEGSHAEGHNAKAFGDWSHAEGSSTGANAPYSHAEGQGSAVGGSATAAHAEGSGTEVSGPYSHTEGFYTKSPWQASAGHAEGYATKITAKSSSYIKGVHVEGLGTIASGEAQHVQGKFNEDIPEAAFIIGNGSGTINDKGEITEENRSNALVIDWEGNARFNGDVFSKDGQLLSENQLEKTIKGLYITSGQKEGVNLGEKATAEGNNTEAIGYISHAEGSLSRATGIYSHAEGCLVVASGESSHAEGFGTKATGNYSHAGGIGTISKEEAQTAIGKYNTVSKDAIFIVGNGTDEDEKDESGNIIVQNRSNAFEVLENGDIKVSKDVLFNNNISLIEKLNEALNFSDLGQTIQTNTDDFSLNQINSRATGKNSVAFGDLTIAEGENAHSEGGWYDNNGNIISTTASGKNSHAEGEGALASGIRSHAEGLLAKAYGEASHAEGWIAETYNKAAHAEGQQTKAYGEASHAEGYKCITGAINDSSKGQGAHAEGRETEAIGARAHAEGYKTKALGTSSHAEGNETIASGEASHTEGSKTEAKAIASHASGYQAVVEEGANGAHACGYSVVANSLGQMVVGKFNATNDSALFIVGSGSEAKKDSSTNEIIVNEERFNAFEVIYKDKECSLKIGNTIITETQLQGLLSLLSSSTPEEPGEQVNPETPVEPTEPETPDETSEQE